mmetsp:Transcript_3071/g.12285  ORF Transcript_3071/g.12285 Transcript_3071/m.12285 type:complete len:210 (+) Transcript_3071:520-1149(+)
MCCCARCRSACSTSRCPLGVPEPRRRAGYPISRMLFGNQGPWVRSSRRRSCVVFSTPSKQASHLFPARLLSVSVATFPRSRNPRRPAPRGRNVPRGWSGRTPAPCLSSVPGRTGRARAPSGGETSGGSRLGLPHATSGLIEIAAQRIEPSRPAYRVFIAFRALGSASSCWSASSSRLPLSLSFISFIRARSCEGPSGVRRSLLARHSSP